MQINIIHSRYLFLQLDNLALEVIGDSDTRLKNSDLHLEILNFNLILRHMVLISRTLHRITEHPL